MTDKKGNDESAVDIDDSQGWLIGAEYKLPNQSKWAVKAQYSQNSTIFKNGAADFDAKQILVGTD